MSTRFADTHYFLALVNPRDEHHQMAKIASGDASQRLVTTQWVLTEVGNAMHAPVDRAMFGELLDTLSSDSHVSIIAASTESFLQGVELFRGRADKHWSLVDCISFSTMNERGLKEALTADQHFEQAGFVALLRQG